MEPFARALRKSSGLSCLIVPCAYPRSDACFYSALWDAELASDLNESAISRERPVCGQQDDILARGLSDQHPIKRVAVVPLQHRHSGSMFGPQRQTFK